MAPKHGSVVLFLGLKLSFWIFRRSVKRVFWMSCVLWALQASSPGTIKWETIIVFEKLFGCLHPIQLLFPSQLSWDPSCRPLPRCEAFCYWLVRKWSMNIVERLSNGNLGSSWSKMIGFFHMINLYISSSSAPLIVMHGSKTVFKLATPALTTINGLNVIQNPIWSFHFTTHGDGMYIFLQEILEGQ